MQIFNFIFHLSFTIRAPLSASLVQVTQFFFALEKKSIFFNFSVVSVQVSGALDLKME